MKKFKDVFDWYQFWKKPAVLLGKVFPSLQSLPFSELGRFGITNQTHSKDQLRETETEISTPSKSFVLL